MFFKPVFKVIPSQYLAFCHVPSALQLQNQQNLLDISEISHVYLNKESSQKYRNIHNANTTVSIRWKWEKISTNLSN